MSHVRTMESLNKAGRGLLEVGSVDSPHGLQSRLEQLNESWEFVRCETERRQLELENRLSQVQQEPAILDKETLVQTLLNCCIINTSLMGPRHWPRGLLQPFVSVGNEALQWLTWNSQYNSATLWP